MNQIDVYAAGLVDGEGCIGIHRYPKAKNYYPFASIEMTIKAANVLQRLQQEYGGHINRRDRSEKSASTMVLRIRTAQDLRRFLTCIEPFLILKAEQARLASRLLDITAEAQSVAQHKNFWTDDLRQRAGRIWVRVKELNLRGPQESVPDGWFARLVGDTWVTSQQDMFSDLGLESFCGPWPRAGSMQNGTAYRQRPLAPLLRGIVSSSWASPTVRDAKTKGGSSYGRSLSRELGGYPSPAFVEWLMGFPAEWVAVEGTSKLQHWRTLSFPRLQSGSEGKSLMHGSKDNEQKC